MVPVTWNVASGSLVTTFTRAKPVLAGRVIVPPARAFWPLIDKMVKSVLEAFLTETRIAYSLVAPLAAVTFTDKLFRPVRSAPLPITEALAAESLGTATTSTARVPNATSIN